MMRAEAVLRGVQLPITLVHGEPSAPANMCDVRHTTHHSTMPTTQHIAMHQHAYAYGHARHLLLSVLASVLGYRTTTPNRASRICPPTLDMP